MFGLLAGSGTASFCGALFERRQMPASLTSPKALEVQLTAARTAQTAAAAAQLTCGRSRRGGAHADSHSIEATKLVLKRTANLTY
jgi:hypothetical protein